MTLPEIDCWRVVQQIVENGWELEFSAERRGVTARRLSVTLTATGPTWAFAIESIWLDVQRADSLAGRPHPNGSKPYTALNDCDPIQRVKLIGEACESLKFPVTDLRVRLDISRAPDTRKSVNHAVAVFTSAPINAIVTQRGTHWDRCTELLLEWPPT